MNFNFIVKFFQTFLALAFIQFAGISAAASSQKIEQISLYKPTLEVVHRPAQGVEAEADIGQTIISSALLITYPAVRVKTNLQFDFETPTFDNDYAGTVTITAGVLKKHSESAEGTFYKASTATLSYTEFLTRKNLLVDAGVYVPFDTTKKAVLWKGPLSGMTTQKYYFGDEPVSFEQTVFEQYEAKSIKKELIYGGVTQGQINISYREYIENMARPAFTQEIKYDLAQGDVIGFRGARFKILGADNTGLRYKVLRNLD